MPELLDTPISDSPAITPYIPIIHVNSNISTLALAKLLHNCRHDVVVFEDYNNPAALTLQQPGDSNI